MRSPREIYAQYKIMPNLQLHQLRVAAVTKLICDNFRESINTNDVILAALFHDMGNILKFDLTFFPDAVEPESVQYWEQVKSDFQRRYGKNQHEAAAKIALEIGLSERVRELIPNVKFSGLLEILEKGDTGQKIVEYGDCRVSPFGITSMRERFLEGRKRHLHCFPHAAANNEQYDKLTDAAHKIEKQLFEKASIRPEDINDSSAAPIIEELWEYPVP